MPPLSFFERLGQRSGRKYMEVGRAIRRRTNPQRDLFQGADVLDKLEQDLKSFARGEANSIANAPITKAGKWTYNRLINRDNPRRVFSGGRKILGSMGRHPGWWGLGIGMASLTVGVIRGTKQGLTQQGYPVETQPMTPVLSYGSGYQTWAHGRGRPMSPNTMGVAGLPQALHKTRHR